MKLATNCVPHFGGTYSWFCRLSAGLATYGIVLRWLGVGADAAAVMRDDVWVHERAKGEVVAPGVITEDDTAASLVVEHLKREQYDGVLVSVLSGRLLTNLIRYLPAEFLRVSMVHSTSLATYKAAHAMRDYAFATVCVSKRIQRDLVTHYGFDEKRTLVIPNAVDLKQYQYLEPSRGRGRTLKVISLGRLEEETKGIFWLPKIFAALDDLDVTLTIAGEGPDRSRLQAMCTGMGSRVTFLGPVRQHDVPQVLARHDVFLMPSRHEGFGQTLIEAMAAGCVPVASRIRGVTDTIICPEEDGLLFPIGDAAAGADMIRRLARDRSSLEQMSDAAKRNVRRFSIENMAAQYPDLLKRARAAPSTTARPLPLDRWYYPRALRPSLRTYLPVPVKKSLRLWRERFAGCVHG